ncbi:MAG: LLM class flavin-dependent oxidoreductase [Candidatus Binatia bacterium]|jgi:alkanesulfonate monooxygenase SsuD/methylene tetrahydromethanopterin reductase-like flavin-dependent oxidoreductase (luciferase family)|nr:LLM class flavin-dependent oxidoreductase [Candidatus Binatia bacterium]MDG1958881.1 LLM class flavin-dependent oxidoreductase [Candidatus Binatia bacterium]MDG2011095.1 LLM class flavin-dependent oxidoreductase [Candidatus Binatia bacterium]
MKISLCIPYAKTDYDRQTTLDWCRMADEGPFASLGCGERIVSHTQDMSIVLAAACALTERVRIVPSLYILPMHSAVRVAKELATMDVLSDGRVTATVGVGGREHDYKAVGASFKKRLQRLDAGVAEMKRTWDGVPPFEGTDPVGPPPVQKGGIPIWSGAMNPKSIARSSKWADGLYGFTMNGDAGPAKQQFDLATAAWEAEGRARPYLATGFWCCLADDAENRLKQYVVDYLKIIDENIANLIADTMVTSNEDAVRKCLDDIEALGADECFLNTATRDLVEIEKIANIVETR